MTLKGGVSVLLPARHVGKAFLRATSSVLMQLNGERDELLVIVEKDDSKTLDLCSKLRDDRIRILKTDSGDPLAAKLNFGLSAANGEFVARMDADDVSLPWRLRRQKSQQKIHSGVIVSTAVVFGSDLRPIPVLPQPPVSLNHSQFRVALLMSNPAVHPTLFAPTEVIRSIGGYRDVPGEDLDLWLRLALADIPLRRDWLPVLLYRYSKKSMSHGQQNTLKRDAEASGMPLRVQLMQQMIGEEVQTSAYSRMLATHEVFAKLNWRIRLEKRDYKLNH